jgi:hypothetical protein
MATQKVPVGSKVHFVWVSGKTNSFVFRGVDSKGPIFEDMAGKRNLAATEKPYLSMTVEPPRES